MTRSLTTPRSLALFALFAAMLLAVMAVATPARADDGPLVVIDCYDPALESFVPCDDIVPGADTPSECPDGTHAVPTVPGQWECVPDGPDCIESTSIAGVPDCEPEITCERIDWALGQGHTIPAWALQWYELNCVDDDFNCDDLAYAIAIGALISSDAWDWYHENCVDDELDCDDIAQVIASGGLLTDDSYDWYQENCQEPDYDCDDIAEILAHGGILTIEAHQWYERNCQEPDCEDIAKKLGNDARLPIDEQQWYDENCDRAELDCDDIAHLIGLGDATEEQKQFFERECDEPELTCEDLAEMLDSGVTLTPEQSDFYTRNCERTEYNCDDLLADTDLTFEEQFYLDRYCERPECEVDCDDIPECTEDCDNDNEPQCLEADGCGSQTEETPVTETPVTETPVTETVTPVVEVSVSDVPLPPDTGAGAAFTTVAGGGLGLASLALIATGGALAGSLMRRRAR